MKCFTFTENGTNYSSSYYYVTNLQGDVIAILNANHAIVAEYTYDAWGNILSITNASGATITAADHIANLNPLRYRGYVYDNETGFYYLQSRYYDPVVGRFINLDAFVSTGVSFGGFNMFAYCNNNPVMYVDYFGTKSAWEDLGFVYDGSMRDFKRADNGEPPYAYEIWLRSMEEQKTSIIDDDRTIIGVTNIPADQTTDYYISMTKDDYKADLGPIASFGASILTEIKAISEVIPGLSTVFFINSLIGYFNSMQRKCDVQGYINAMEQGQSVLIVRWESNEESMLNGWTSYYSWNEEELPFLK